MVFGCCGCSPAIKINSDWHIAVTLKKICIIENIVSWTTLYLVKNFKPYDKHIRILAKKIGLVTRNISAKIFRLQLEEIWKNRELAKLEKLMSKKENCFAETLQ